MFGASKVSLCKDRENNRKYKHLFDDAGIFNIINLLAIRFLAEKAIKIEVYEDFESIGECNGTGSFYRYAEFAGYIVQGLFDVADTALGGLYGL